MIRGADIVDELLAGMGEGVTDARHAIHLVGLGVWRVRASLSAREWAQAFGVGEDEIAGALARTGTVGGLVLDRLGRLAAVGDEVAIGPATLRVESVAGRRIETIEVRLDEGDRDGLEGGGHDAG
jgi:CBS domain containing-hemolysin-like protein